ncbi:histidine phosphatase superfamily [Globomyces pollinis-pini]|nr:histidine phosphatase superfamily [Globomyces pollinis-pini]
MNFNIVLALLSLYTTAKSDDDFKLLKNLGTKSPYPSPDYEEYEGKCKLVQVQLYGRHGARYATKSKSKDMFQVAKYLRENADKVKDPYLANLTIPFPEGIDGALAPVGFKDMKNFGDRFNKRYSKVLSQKGTVLYSSISPRVVDSAKSFMDGFMGASANLVNVTVLNKDLDADLNPGDACSEHAKFENETEANLWSDIYLTPISTRLSSQIGIPIDTKQSFTLIDICAAQVGLLGYKRNEGVCYLFSDDEIRGYSIADKLEKYYTHGYGQEINTKMMCSAWTGLRNEILRRQELKITYALRFGHAETIIPLVSTLGLFKDEVAPVASMTFNQLLKHKFKITKISPFQANVAFEVYDCGKEGSSLRVLLNEEPIKIPALEKSDDDLYNVDEFFKVFGNLLDCNFDEVCKNEKKTFGGWNRVYSPLN